MGPFVTFLIALALTTSGIAYEATVTPNHILFLMQSGLLDQAIENYQQFVQKQGKHDYELLQHLSVLILKQGIQSSEPEEQLLALFGAGIALNERALDILEKGIKSPHPILQLVSLQALARYQDDQADLLLDRALGSIFLQIRLEGALYLAKRKTASAIGQIEALISKVPPEVVVVFPQIFATLETPRAIKNLRKLLAYPSAPVRVAAVLSVGKYARDELLPVVRVMITHHNSAQQEACAWTLAELQDQSAVVKLQKLAKEGASYYARLAAMSALATLTEDRVAIDFMQGMAKEGELFAIAQLSHFPTSADLLFELMKSSDRNIKLNAAIGLLEQKDKRVFSFVREFVKDRESVIQKINSPGGSLSYYKFVHSTENEAQEYTASIKEEMLEMASELDDKEFLALAEELIETQDAALIPVLIQAVEKKGLEEEIKFLKKHQQKVGAPLVRGYCNLALFRLQEEGPYAENVKMWIKQKQQTDLIQFRPSTLWSVNEENSFQLSPKETSKLLVESFEALAEQQHDESLSILLDAIQHGNAKNRYALAGLLLRAAQ